MPFAFKLEPSLNLIPTLYFGLKFPILIINGYDKKANACSPWTSCSPSLLLVTLQAFSGISRNSEQKIILQTTKQLIQFRVLEIQFRPLKYISAIRIRKKFEQHPIPIQAIATRPEQCWWKKPTSNSFETLKTVYTYSNCMINQLLYCWNNF